MIQISETDAQLISEVVRQAKLLVVDEASCDCGAVDCRSLAYALDQLEIRGPVRLA
jgi:hypothetical protein